MNEATKGNPKKPDGAMWHCGQHRVFVPKGQACEACRDFQKVCTCGSRDDGHYRGCSLNPDTIDP